MDKLLKELEVVVGLADRLDQLADAVTEQRWNEFSMRVPAEVDRDADLVLSTIARFLRTHHAEIAEAVADARRYRQVTRSTMAQLSEWHRLAGLSHRHGGAPFDDSVDAAIDAQHNSAREGLG